ncbi:MAG: radical SAM protein, partial [Chlorobaculum sp.]|nr:radical SAM protein [Chlorobaculum sp.]
LLDTVAAIASRHPVQERELETALGKLFDGDAAKIREALDSLFASGRFDKVRQGEELYWIVKTA